ncbi:hypothetical protein [Dactylosporangium matsuzakiense]|uniref:Uncharacterized protein n=1 Tax=Dactylosporangium matsuzakiense TaxID=53360 RepID=A0A9W6NRV2_9ACTN|nr:hypothetical protein [Dactylosporangium matsuzakiense]UWZ46505.1 hypothetical protein Dmats_08815 [Dactylosporangium matsuzakiense]GLL06641.1 hypothetical protein GCM10017581_083910 [Dactylosporangium matsuzakiense]
MPPSTLPAAEVVPVAVIELGDVAESWDADLDGGPVGLPRGWGLLLSLGLVLSLVSAVPLRETVTELARQPLRNGAFQLAGDVLLVLESDRTPTPVEAFDGGGDTPRWTFTPDGLSTLAYASAAPGDVVVLWPDLCRSGVTGTTVGVDRRSGRVVWQVPGVPVRTAAAVPGTVVMRSLWSDGCGALAAGAPIGGALRWQDLGAGGAVRWEVPVEAGTRVAVDSAESGAGWAALTDRDGAISIADFATGRRAAAGALRAEPGELVAAAGDLLVIAGIDGRADVSVLRAYRRGVWDLPIWQVSVPTGAASGRTDRFTVRPCGPVLCVAGQRTMVLDPATGAVRWTPGVRAELVAAPGGRLATAGSPSSALLDPVTGHATAALPGWSPLGADATRMLLGTGAGADATLLGWRDGDRVAPIGTVEGRLIACALDGPRLACSTDSDEVVLLRLAT